MFVVYTAPRSRAQSLAADIEDRIAAEGLQPGDRIATMEELRAETGLGRATISEAARLLAEHGTVEIRPGRGGGLFAATIGPVVRLRHTLLAVDHDGVTVADAIAVREALEELIDVDAAAHCTARDAKSLTSILNRMRRTSSTRSRYLSANWELHERIAAITPNEIARGVYLGTLHHVAGLPGSPDPQTARDDQGYLATRIDIHAELVAAIVAGDRSRTIRAVEAHRGRTQ